MRNEDEFYELAKSIGGKIVKLNTNKNCSINIFDIDKPEITKDYLKGKECDLRKFLDVANKENMMGTKIAIEKLKDLSFLDNEPKWKEIVEIVLKEYANLMH